MQRKKKSKTKKTKNNDGTKAVGCCASCSLQFPLPWKTVRRFTQENWCWCKSTGRSRHVLIWFRLRLFTSSLFLESKKKNKFIPMYCYIPLLEQQKKAADLLIDHKMKCNSTNSHLVHFIHTLKHYYVEHHRAYSHRPCLCEYARWLKHYQWGCSCLNMCVCTASYFPEKKVTRTLKQKDLLSPTSYNSTHWASEADRNDCIFFHE